MASGGWGLSLGAHPLGAGPQPHSAQLTGLSVFLLEGRFGPSVIRGLLAVSLTANALFTSAYLYQSLR